MKIDHINIVVKDLEKAKEFFLDLGFIITKPQDTLEGKWLETLSGLQNVKAEYVALGFPNRETNLELMQFYTPIGNTEPNISRLNQIGMRHLAREVEHIEEHVKKLKAKGFIFFSEIQVYKGQKKLCYFQGPEGIILELAEYGKFV